jgi:hypothetical protein
VRFSSGSTTALANRPNSTFCTGSKASQSSTRKIESSAKYWCMVSLSCREEARSVPNGFSTITRAPLARPAVAMPCAIRPNKNGGTSR